MKNINIKFAVALLNEAFAADPGAIHALVCNRVPCNAALADHPTIVVHALDSVPGAPTVVGLLGILNGIFADETCCIGASWGADTDVDNSREFLGFVVAKRTPATAHAEA